MTGRDDIPGLTTPRLIVRRLVTDWRLMSSVFLGIMVATLLMAATPVYLDALERQSINSAVESAVERSDDVFFGITVISDFVTLEGDEIGRTDSAHAQVIDASVAPIHTGTRRHLKTPFYPMVLPRALELEDEDPDADSETREDQESEGRQHPAVDTLVIVGQETGEEEQILLRDVSPATLDVIRKALLDEEGEEYQRLAQDIPSSILDEIRKALLNEEHQGLDPGIPPNMVVTGILQYYEDLEEHISFVDGRPLVDTVTRGTLGPMIEAVISATTTARFGDLSPGDVIVVAPSLDAPLKISVRIVGVIEAADPSESYWQTGYDDVLYPLIPGADGTVTSTSPPALGLLVGKNALATALDTAFPGAAVDSTWYSDVDPTVLKTWSKDEMRSRMELLRQEISLSLPDAFVFSGIDVMLIRFGRQSFLTSVPLLLLLTVLGVAVLYFLFMIVSYLVPSREGDVALFRSRGASTWRIFRVYLAEGTILTLVAAALAPGPALLLVWLAGLLPHFSHITGGRPLPVHLTWMPFAAAAVAGLVCMVIFVVPGVVGTRAGLIVHRLRASRPPVVPLMQRYNIDVMFLVVGGVLFWELRERGELVSGSLFGQQDVNEALLVSPVLFLMAVGLLFLRVFPMFVRYVSGESLALIHLATAATLPTLAAAIGIEGMRAEDQTGWGPPVVALCGFGAAYWVTSRVSDGIRSGLGMAAQAGFALWFLYMLPPDPDTSAAVFVGSIALALIVPGQLLFLGLAFWARRAPVWVSLALLHIARNPLQYSWLMLLLVLGAGIGVLATTVGATLDRSYEERIRYRVGSDVRVFKLEPYLGRRDGRVERTFGAVPGVRSLSAGVRGQGRIGAGRGNLVFSYLAVDSDSFDAWYRDDFSRDSLRQTLSKIRPEPPADPILIPEGPDKVQLWLNPAAYYSLIFLWVVVEDANGRIDTVSLGEIGRPGWTLMSADLPDNLVRPLKVVSIQLNEAGFGATGTVGEVLLDDLQAFTSSSGEVMLLEGFEGSLEWLPIATTELGSDELLTVSEDVHSGANALWFSFGKENNRGIRGVYRSAGAGFLPVIASSSFSALTGAQPGAGMLVTLPGGIVPVVVREVVDYFPTMDPGVWGFLIFDVRALLAYTDSLDPIYNAPVNELFLRVEPGAGGDVLRELDEMLRFKGDAIGVEAEMAAQAADPLISAGWRTLVLVSLAVVLFITALGYVVYLMAHADRSVGEMASLRSLGLNRAQTISLLAFEHMLVALVGLGLGTWAGFQMSRIMVSSVTVTDSGGRVLPPFILTTDWTLLVPLFALLIAIFVASLLTIGGRVLSIDLRHLSRLEG